MEKKESLLFLTRKVEMRIFSLISLDFNSEKIPQNNFSCQNLSIENK